MTPATIDLYSDTKTRPTPGMRRAIAEAEVGDEQQFEDPTVLRLTRRVAEMLGHEDAVFLPSGTMANEIAVLLHCVPGDEVIAHEWSHLLNFESGAPAALAGVMARPLTGAHGMFDAEAVRRAVRPLRRLMPMSRLVVVEQTTNIGGGAVWPLEKMQSVASAAREHGLALHLDGARLMNAAVAADTAPASYSRLFDTVLLDFTKGLGAPVGAVLAGSAQLIERAWRFKQRLGGSMRQAGLLAAGCLYALDHHVERLAQDHENAQTLAAMLGDVPGLSVDAPWTNMVFIDVSALGISAESFNDLLAGDGIRMSVLGPTRLRAVTHLDIGREAITTAATAVKRIAGAAGRVAA